jgi:hypothetical protein
MFNKKFYELVKNEYIFFIILKQNIKIIKKKKFLKKLSFFSNFSKV